MANVSARQSPAAVFGSVARMTSGCLGPISSATRNEKERHIERKEREKKKERKEKKIERERVRERERERERKITKTNN